MKIDATERDLCVGNAGDRAWKINFQGFPGRGPVGGDLGNGRAFSTLLSFSLAAACVEDVGGRGSGERGREAGGYISVPQFANEHVLDPGVLNDIPSAEVSRRRCFFSHSGCSSRVISALPYSRAQPRIFFFN